MSVEPVKTLLLVLYKHKSVRTALSPRLNAYITSVSYLCMTATQIALHLSTATNKTMPSVSITGGKTSTPHLTASASRDAGQTHLRTAKLAADALTQSSPKPVLTLTLIL
jgi:hypothetical protein